MEKKGQVELEFTSLEEVKKFYFPKEYEKEQWEKILETKDPRELGRAWAKDTIETIRKMLETT